MYSVILLGTGNLAQHLFDAFLPAKGVHIVQVYGRSTSKLSKFGEYTDICVDPSQIKNADIYIVAVKDDAIHEVAQFLLSKKGIVVHTSGATAMDEIPFENKGVFYPLQTFSKDRPVHFKDVPICIEAKQPSALKILRELGGQISSNVVEINSEQRKKLHLAAVFVNNFTNHLYQIGADICQKKGLSFSLLRPLIQETAEKVQLMLPYDAQTGPARRGDIKSIEGHLKLLNNEKQAEIYTLLSAAIKKAYEEKL